MAVGSSGDRLCQTRLIPRSPDGDNKWAMLQRVNSLVNIFFYLGEMAFMQGMAAAG